MNNLALDDADMLRAAYGPNLARLVEIKRRHDPDDVFHLNHHIRPAPVHAGPVGAPA